MWLKIKVWTKVTLFAAVLLYVLIFIFMNGDKTAKFWYWPKREPEWPVLFLVLGAFLTGVIGTILIRTTFNTIRQIRDLKARSFAERRERELRELKHLEAMRQKPASDAATAADVVTPTDAGL
jgi:uncharacterized integral membrane protein